MQQIAQNFLCRSLRTCACSLGRVSRPIFSPYDRISSPHPTGEGSKPRPILWPATSSDRAEWRRGMGGGLAAAGGFDKDKEIDEINRKFADAREEIAMATDSKDTVYFDEEVETAREAVKIVLNRFEGLLARLPDSEREALQRSMGLKMEQLKAELQQLND